MGANLRERRVRMSLLVFAIAFVLGMLFQAYHAQVIDFVKKFFGKSEVQK